MARNTSARTDVRLTINEEPGNGDVYRALPSVGVLLGSAALEKTIEALGRDTVVALVREVLSDARLEIATSGRGSSKVELIKTVIDRARRLESPLRRVINATGVVIHTNLGRAPLSRDAIIAAAQVAQGYSNLEYDLDDGVRGSRDRHLEAILCRLTGAEAALAVNNNASALLLALSALAAGREAIVSRGQAVEIGGGFRIPDVMLQSGARLVEVGTTNRTYQRDYAAAVTPETAVLLRVHSSNFRVIGFTHEATLGELTALAAERGLTVIDDLGSGCLIDTRQFGLQPEPLIGESVKTGADVICFSGDKLLGGPQAGIIVGKRAAIDRIRRHPLARAVRIDKLTLAALIATLLHYARGEAERTVPVWRMISATLEEIERRAQTWAAQLGGDVIAGESTIGGGSLPGETLPTRLLALDPATGAETLARRLRMGQPAIVGRIDHDRVLLDPRTVLPEEDEALIAAARLAVAGSPPPTQVPSP